MQKYVRLFQKGWKIILRRLRTQGLRTTLLWAYGRGMPAFTGVPLLQFCQVTPHLYVGSQFNRMGKRMLEQQGFQACVNMRIERDDAAFGLALAKYLHLPTVDDEAPSVEHLIKGVDFIREIIQSGGKVYIHCGAGVGRAPTMAAAYLIAEGHTLDEALALIRKSRPFITITPPQMQQLKQFEKSLHQKQEISVEAG
jgi:protein tyrosine phosphatase (PTP) superfamily phosphohydrolase (DUF442 family)